MDFDFFKQIETYTKLYEAALNGTEDEDISETQPENQGEEENNTQDTQDTENQDNQNQEPDVDENDPAIQADTDDGIFISDTKKAEYAKNLLTALTTNPPAQGSIPQDLLNVTTANADKVIQYVTSILTVDSSLALDHENDPNTLIGSLKEMPAS